jgi:glycine/D-amino acid oxidase-like deaminating enzyme
MAKIKIGVIGGGIFGATTAVKLAQAGYSVDLYEKNDDLLCAASGINQYRLHRGYHYPRSAPTAISSITAEPSFIEEYKEAIINSPEHYYAIAKEKSFVNGEQFLAFCQKCNLEYEKVDIPLIDKSKVDLIIRAEESLMNPLALRKVVWQKVKETGVKVHLDAEMNNDIFTSHDVVVNATYANLNFILDKYPEAKRDYQFELCEKLVLKLPNEFAGKSIVILDGPFMCIDPYDDTGYHVMGNVVHAIHATNKGLFPVIPEEFKSLLNKGIIKNPPITNLKKFIDSAAEFMPAIKDAEHIGSMYTFRTVLPNVEKTDERPTLVYKVNDRLINIFSGKLGNSVQAAIQVLEIVNELDNSL